MRVLLGICGSVAAYKAAELVRALQERGVTVEVALTQAAERFVTALTFNALTGRRVHTGLWSPEQSEFAPGAIEHIAVAQSIDAFLVAPATATTLARFAQGIADDFLSSTYLATKAPVILAPAMNVNMWQHPATQANVGTLLARGAHLVAPEEGYLACGMTGGGRLASLARIVDSTLEALNPRKDLCGEVVLLTAGGTREPLDPVRYLGNRSSGRMGYALAEAAVARGARVILISASELPPPPGCEVHPVFTAAEMGACLQQFLDEASLIVGAAAVADFRPVQPSAEKLRRAGTLTLTLEATEDLIAFAAAHRRPGALVIAFAAESGDILHKGREKLHRKHVDAVFANNISEPGLGFNADRNAGLFITAGAVTTMEPQSKRALADKLLDQILGLKQGPGSAGRHSV